MLCQADDAAAHLSAANSQALVRDVAQHVHLQDLKEQEQLECLSLLEQLLQVAADVLQHGSSAWHLLRLLHAMVAECMHASCSETETVTMTDCLQEHGQSAAAWDDVARLLTSALDAEPNARLLVRALAAIRGFCPDHGNEVTVAHCWAMDTRKCLSHAHHVHPQYQSQFHYQCQYQHLY